MKEIANIIKYHQGPPRGHSFFHICEEGKTNRSARVSARKLVEIRQKIESQLRNGKAILGVKEILYIHLPQAFICQLQRVGIEPFDAWTYMAEINGQIPANDIARSSSRVRSNSAQVQRLARILAGVSGGKKSPNELIFELMELLSTHNKEAMRLLEEWASNFGYSKRGYIIVGNRANKAARKHQ